MGDDRSRTVSDFSEGDRVESETDLIQTYLAPLALEAPGAFGLRDDAALIAAEPGSDLVVSTDPIIEGVHFFPDDAAADIAWKALAVNVSDIVAKGGTPVAYLMTLALPQAPERTWIGNFAKGLLAAQDAFGCVLIGGDTDRTPGPLSIGITAFGRVPFGMFVPRQGAQAGDHVFITGSIGDAALGLALHRDSSLFATALTEEGQKDLVARYLRPRPRIALANAIREHARAALDISDGLMKDLARLVGDLSLTLKFDDVPISPFLRAALAADERVRDAVLGGGDDYELLVAVAPENVAAFRDGAAEAGVAVMDAGVLGANGGLSVVDSRGGAIMPGRYGYDHFAA